MKLTWEEYWYVRVLAVLVAYQIQASRNPEGFAAIVYHEKKKQGEK